MLHDEGRFLFIKRFPHKCLFDFSLTVASVRRNGSHKATVTGSHPKPFDVPVMANV